MLWRARGEDFCGGERELQDLDGRGTDTGAAAEDEDRSRPRSGGCAAGEEREGNLECRVDYSCGGAVTDSEFDC